MRISTHKKAIRDLKWEHDRYKEDKIKLVNILSLKKQFYMDNIFLGEVLCNLKKDKENPEYWEELKEVIEVEITEIITGLKEL